MTLINPNGEIEYKYQGICKGSIALNPSGENGFGYDPIFLIDNNKRTMAELSEKEKNSISHRSIAVNHVIEYIKNHLVK